VSKKYIKILAIETSCDETAAAVIDEVDVVDDGATRSRISSLQSGMTRPVVLSNIVSSSVDLHAKTGGIVPEVASREQMKCMVPVVSAALLSSRAHSTALRAGGGVERSSATEKDIYTLAPQGVEMTDNSDYQQSIKLLDGITHIAVTAGPGLIGSLLVGFNAAKTLAYAKNLPIIPINHIEGHIYSAFSGEIRNPNIEILNKSQNSKSQFPIIILTVSGGHTMLVLMRDHGKYELLGQAIDDAVGEAYDKVARLLGLGYPGGPAISELAEQFRNRVASTEEQVPSARNSELGTHDSILLPRPIMRDGTFNFSFSGLKTAVLIWTKKICAEKKLDSAEDIDLMTKRKICAEFEESVADVLSAKLSRAVEKYQPKSIIFAGGVSANNYLVESIKYKVIGIDKNIQFLTPSRNMTGDNAAMIGLAAYYHIKCGDVSSWRDIKVDANLKLV